MMTTAFMKNARCYAPEIKNTRNVSQPSDVYSFGILLLELLTRKSSIQVVGGHHEAVDLVKLVNSVKSNEWIAKVFDTDLLKNPSINKQMVKMLQIGISCASKSPKKRPKMSEVVTMIEGISMMNTENQVPHVPLEPKLVFLENGVPPFGLEDMLRASAKLLGEGLFGTSYEVRLDEGNTIMVKRLRKVYVSSVTQKEFHQHMEVLGRIRHENVTKLKAYCYLKDTKLLIYDYYNQDSVSTLLYGKINQIRVHVDWEARLRIAIGAARGISQIHMQNGGKLIHRNIKASNIFLNSQQYGCVPDFGLATMITSFMGNARCYAPEVNSTQDVSQESDVYSFGIFLLELLTRKSFALDKLVNSINNSEWNANVFDKDLFKNFSPNEQMVNVLKVGISCVAKSPQKRPKMSEVVKMIEDINLMNIGSHVPVLQYVPAFDFKYMLSAPLELLGKGTFGTSYVVRSGKRDTFVVKKLKEVNVAEKEFQQHMEIIGRIRHDNVAPLRAYSYTKDEKLSVYDYYHEGSVYAMLRRDRCGYKIYLDWACRLKIAIGVARGIAHIHTHNDSKLMHGNITTSNIFLAERKYCFVTDVGLAELVISPIKSSVMQSSGYYAPELTGTNRVSQTSEVYSFGVVLLELLTGKPSLLTSHDDDGETEIISLVRWIHSVARLEWSAEIFDAELLRYENEEKAMMHC